MPDATLCQDIYGQIVVCVTFTQKFWIFQILALSLRCFYADNLNTKANEKKSTSHSTSKLTDAGTSNSLAIPSHITIS